MTLLPASRNREGCHTLILLLVLHWMENATSRVPLKLTQIIRLTYNIAND